MSYGDGKPVVDGFEYHSGNNNQWLSIDDMQEMLHEFYPPFERGPKQYGHIKSIIADL